MSSISAPAHRPQPTVHRAVPPLLRRGSHGAQVAHLQTLLKANGANPGPVDGAFGPKTQAAVRHFQAAHGLTADGVAGPKTWATLHQVQAARAEVFQVGDRGHAIATAERRLKTLGYEPGAVDGKFDAQTAQAISAFRRDDHLKSGHALTLAVRKALHGDVQALQHDPLHARVKPSKQHRRLDAATDAAVTQDVQGQLGLGEGSSGRTVKNIQAHLGAAGFAPKGADGHFDARTKGAVEAFQRHSGLLPTGRVDSGTWKKLKASFLYARSGTSPAQTVGEKSGAVLHTEKLLRQLGFHSVKADGIYDSHTASAVSRFERKHHLKATGAVNAHTLAAMKHAASASGPISAAGKRQMQALLRVAQANAGGKHPMGWCLKAVEDDLQRVSYGKIGHGNIPRFAYAHQFADYLNAGHRYAQLGLKKLKLSNPYAAPPGSIIVVRAGTPGTAHPFAGDIVVRGHGSHLYNDGEMGYGGPGNFPKGNSYVLGIYAPA